MNREEIIQAKDKLNHCIEFYENMCEPREVQPILTGEEKKALKSLLRYNDNLEQQCQKQKEVINRIFNETTETRNIINNNRGDNILTKGCLIHYLGIVEDLLEEVSE